MTEQADDPRARIAAALDDPAPDAPLRLLEAAFLLAASALREVTENGPLPPIEAVIAVDDALTGAAGLVAGLPALLAAAQAGPAAEQYLREQAARLAEAEAAAADARARLDELRAAEDGLRARETEHAALRAEVARLRRLERLVGALDEIAGQRDLITERVAVLTERAGDIEAVTAAGAADLLRLTGDRLALLDGPTRSAVERAAEAQSRLAAEEERAAVARAELDRATARLDALAAERDGRVAALRAHAEADRVVAGAIGAAGALTALLDGVEGRLRDVDDALGRALEAGRGRLAAERAVRDWGEATG